MNALLKHFRNLPIATLSGTPDAKRDFSLQHSATDISETMISNRPAAASS
jgi:hypothetical protein